MKDDMDQNVFDFYDWGSPRALLIERAFTRFFKDNPTVWQWFQKFTNDIIRAGYKHYGVGCVFERIRWHVNIDTRSGDGFKLNNNFRAYYARLFHIARPDLKKRFFRNRERVSTGQSKNVSERALNRRLRRLL